MERIPGRVINDAYQRIAGQGDKLKGVLKSFINGIKQRPKDAIQRWKDWIRDIKEKGLLDGAKTAKLRNCLERIPRRTLKDAHERIIGDGSKVTGVIKRMLHAA